MTFNAAVEDGDDEATAKLLMELEDHSIDTIGPEGDTLLHLACLYAHHKCAKLLVEHGASLATTDEDESTVLHDAAAGGDMEIVKLLVDKAPSLVHAVDNDGDTPLHNAARGGNTDVVAFLLLEGANPHIKNKEGRIPRATCEDVDAVIEMLQIAEKGFQEEA